MLWALLLLPACAPKTILPPAPPEALGQAIQGGDHWGVLEQASTLVDTSIRQRALYLLVRFTPEPGGGIWAPRGLGDPSPYVQRRCVEALMQRPNDALALTRLKEHALSSTRDPYSRGLAGLAIAKKNDTSILPALLESIDESLHHSNSAPLALAAHAMGDPKAGLWLEKALRKGDFPLEIDFFSSLGRHPTPDLADALQAGLPFIEEELYLPIAMSLMDIQHPKGERIFLEALQNEDIERQHEALDFLRLSSAHARVGLIEKASRSPHKSIRLHAQMLLESQREPAPKRIFEGVEAVDRETRVLAFGSLGDWARNHPSRSRPLQKARKLGLAGLGDLEASVQEAALVLLSHLAEESDRPQLEAFTLSEDPRHRVEAASAILHMDARQSAP